jgi:hypothetical protein
VASHRESNNRRCCKQHANRTIDANPAGLQDPGNLYPPIGVRCIVSVYDIRPMRSTQKFLRHAIGLRSEFFHCCIFAGNFTSLSTVQSNLCGD